MGPIRSPLRVAGLALFPLALLLAPPPAPDVPAPFTVPGAAVPAPPVAVTVTFDPNSTKVRVSDDPIRIVRGQEITWAAGSGVEALAIDIASPRAPFGQAVREDGVRTRKGGPPARVRARQGDRFKGTYKYTVAIYDGQQVWILDPDIIIN